MEKMNKFDVYVSGNTVELIPLKHIDIELLRKWRNQDNIRSYYIYQQLITSEQQSVWWENYENNKNDYMFIIHHINANVKIGAVALYGISGKEAEFGRLMIPSEQYRGQGVALEACKLIIQFGFVNLGLQRIYLKVLTENVKAKHIYKKIGFQHIGTEGNVEIYKLIGENWLTDNSFFRDKICKNTMSS